MSEIEVQAPVHRYPSKRYLAVLLAAITWLLGSLGFAFLSLLVSRSRGISRKPLVFSAVLLMWAIAWLAGERSSTSPGAEPNRLVRIARSSFVSRPCFILVALTLAAWWAVVVATPFGLMSFGSGDLELMNTWLIKSFLMFCCAIAWMTAGLFVERKFFESGPLIYLVGAVVSWNQLASPIGCSSPLRGMFEFEMGCLGALLAALLMLRAKRSSQLCVGFLALTVAIAFPAYRLRHREPGHLTKMKNSSGRYEAASFAHPPGWDDQANFVWLLRDDSDPSERDRETFEWSIWMGGGLEQAIRLTDPAEIESAYSALWQTEQEHLDRELERGRVPPFMTELSSLRSTVRGGSIWRTE